jgi:hypothetical protein
MPKQGGQGKGKPKLRDRGFGKALTRNQAHGNQGLSVTFPPFPSFLGHHFLIFNCDRGGLSTTRPKSNMNSMLDASSLDDFVNTAIMDGRELEVKR